MNRILLLASKHRKIGNEDINPAMLDRRCLISSKFRSLLVMLTTWDPLENSTILKKQTAGVVISHFPIWTIVPPINEIDRLHVHYFIILGKPAQPVAGFLRQPGL